MPETPPELVQCVIGGCGDLKIAFFVPFMLITIFFMGIRRFYNPKCSLWRRKKVAGNYLENAQESGAASRACGPIFEV